MKRRIIKEHRVLDDTDLNNINNTFKLIEKTCESLEKSVNSNHNTLVILISAIGIVLTILKVFL
jgi:hypothetical protein